MLFFNTSYIRGECIHLKNERVKKKIRKLLGNTILMLWNTIFIWTSWDKHWPHDIQKNDAACSGSSFALFQVALKCDHHGGHHPQLLRGGLCAIKIVGSNSPFLYSWKPVYHRVNASTYHCFYIPFSWVRYQKWKKKLYFLNFLQFISKLQVVSRSI